MDLRAIEFRELNTPCYIFLPKELSEGVELMKKALDEYWGNCIYGYSFKTNSLPYLINEVNKQGFYAEVVSGDEYLLSLHMGFKNIIYNGPVKDKESFFHALSKGHIINLDAKRELLWLKEYIHEEGMGDFNIGLRVNFDLESACPGETSAGDEGSRFGFSYEKGGFENALDYLKELGVPLKGIHLHASSKTRSVGIYRALSKMAVKLKEEYDLELSFVDIGGGYFGGMKGCPEFPDYIKAVSEELSKGFSPDKTTLIIEPGTSLASRCFEYITEVVDVKTTHTGNIVTVDGSRSDVDPLHTKSGYLFEVLRRDDGEDDHDILEKGDYKEAVTQTICGYTCMEGDRMMTINGYPLLKEGDRIRIMKAGGYTMCLTPLFIKYFPDVYKMVDLNDKSTGQNTENSSLSGNQSPSENGVSGEHRYVKIREHWGFEEYILKNSYESYE